MTRLDRVDGPPCPGCGCPDSAVISSGTRWGQVTEKRQCAVCAAVWCAVVKPPQAKNPEAKKPEEIVAEAVERRRRFREFRQCSGGLVAGSEGNEQ